MVNTTSQGEQFSPQGTGTIRANSINVSTEIPNAQAIPTSGSMALHNSTVMPIISGATETPAVSTPRPPGFEIFRPVRDYPYGMPSTAMAELQKNSSIYTQPHNTVISPIQNSGSGMNHVGRNNQSQGIPTLLPTLTMNNQADFRQQMDASNHDMVGTGGYTLDGKQATDGLSNDVSFGTSVKASGYLEGWLRITRDGNEQRPRETGGKKSNCRRCTPHQEKAFWVSLCAATNMKRNV
ncbi:hypothetical protein KIW84_043798 [Lathyrus oleraceus]|uniref:Uncharacterized protein n=1 Tax=Pisum sativum TaxID=3888 RepID=A0A9D4XIZ0_PEA|nr:hypothetical protein KIW84_043798 [Pisum sativum]